VIGTKLYAKKSRTNVFLLLYGVLALAGCFLTVQSLARNEDLSGSIGFMVIFGLGMFILTLVKSRQPQVSVHAEFLELQQSRVKQLIRYRHIVSVIRPDDKRLVITLRENRIKEEITIWLKDLEMSEVDKLYDFLSQQIGIPK